MLKNNRNPFLIMIITSWVLLLLAMICKLLGADWFIANSDNKTFVRICNYVDNNKVLYNLIPIIFNVITTSIYFMAILKQNRPHLLWFIILIVYASVKVLFYRQIIFMILDFVITIGLPLILDYKKWKAILIGCALNWAFQLISLLTKTNKYGMFDDNTLVIALLSIDYLLMLVLFWLYRIKPKEVLSNG